MPVLSTATLVYDRVRAHTAEQVNARIDSEIEDSARCFAEARGGGSIGRRIVALDCEWDIERALVTNASALSLAGLALTITVSRRWLALPGGVLAFLLLHGLQGWCPPVPLLRRMGFRTRAEIDQERYALKALRGDFEAVPQAGEPARRAEAAVDAARR